jgi:hypothetical protein
MLNLMPFDTVPYDIPVLISKNLTGNLWKDRLNCVVFDPEDHHSFQANIAFALDHPELLEQYATRARHDIRAFAQPTEEAADRWTACLETFCSNDRST